jgi:uncharacterized membrane-anchored protein YhcB (DUF1043 family)
MEHIIGEQKPKPENAPNWAAAIIAIIIGIVAAAVWLQSEFGIRPTRDEVKETFTDGIDGLKEQQTEMKGALKEIDDKLDEMKEGEE